MERHERKRSWTWLLLPVFVHVIGGIIAYYAIRPDEPRMAKDCLYIGIVLSGINCGMFLLLLSMGLLLGEHSVISEFEQSYPWDSNI
jgi:hypothetical protein